MAAVPEPTIALCMIAKNEAKFIEQCIGSVRDLVNEIVLVDTGSDDDTVVIAKRLGARVFFREWDDDFGAARNFSLEHATADWILILDADEAIDSSDHDKIRKLVKNPHACYRLIQRHYTNDHRLSDFEPVRGEYPHWERDIGGFFESGCIRLFPNHAELSYQGKVHELVEHSVRRLGKHIEINSGIRIHHYGHVDGRKKKKKSQLYTPLGEAKINHDSEHWQNHFEMGVEHNCNGRYEESIASFLKGIELNPKYVKSWINLGYVLCQVGRYEHAAQALLTAIELDPESSEAHCNLGVVYLRANALKEAGKHFLAAIELNQTYVNAYCNLAQVFYRMGGIDEAINAYETALQIHPNCAIALSELGAIYLSVQKLEAAEEYLQRSLELDPDLSRSHYHLAHIYKLAKKNEEAADLLDRFCELEEDMPLLTAGPKGAEMMQQVKQESRLLRGG